MFGESAYHIFNVVLMRMSGCNNLSQMWVIRMPPVSHVRVFLAVHCLNPLPVTGFWYAHSTNILKAYSDNCVGKSWVLRADHIFRILARNSRLRLALLVLYLDFFGASLPTFWLFEECLVCERELVDCQCPSSGCEKCGMNVCQCGMSVCKQCKMIGCGCPGCKKCGTNACQCVYMCKKCKMNVCQCPTSICQRCRMYDCQCVQGPTYLCKKCGLWECNCQCVQKIPVQTLVCSCGKWSCKCPSDYKKWVQEPSPCKKCGMHDCRCV